MVGYVWQVRYGMEGQGGKGVVGQVRYDRVGYGRVWWVEQVWYGRVGQGKYSRIGTVWQGKVGYGGLWLVQQRKYGRVWPITVEQPAREGELWGGQGRLQYGMIGQLWQCWLDYGGQIRYSVLGQVRLCQVGQALVRQDRVRCGKYAWVGLGEQGMLWYQRMVYSRVAQSRTGYCMVSMNG